MRNKIITCPATVAQSGGEFKKGMRDHCHPCDPGVRKKVQIIAQVKEHAKADAFRPAAHIAEDAILQHGDDVEEPAVPLITNLQRTANRVRQKGRPRHPLDLNFEVYFLCKFSLFSKYQ